MVDIRIGKQQGPRLSDKLIGDWGWIVNVTLYDSNYVTSVFLFDSGYPEELASF